MSGDALVDAELLRAEVRQKYKEVAVDPGGDFHFHTGRPLADRLGYDAQVVGALPDAAVESFAGVGNPFLASALKAGERVVDVGSGAGFDTFIAADLVGESGMVIGIDMTSEMLDKSRRTAEGLGLTQVEFKEGLAEALPVPGQTLSSRTACSIYAPISKPFSTRYSVCSSRVAGCSLPISPTETKSPRRRFETLTCGRLESPVACRVQAGAKSCAKPALSIVRLARRSMCSAVRVAKRMPERLPFMVMPSSVISPVNWPQLPKHLTMS